MSEIEFKKPCPICKNLMFVTGKDKKGWSLTSCGCRFKFKKTKSQKEFDRKYVRTEWGLEIRK